MENQEKLLGMARKSPSPVP